MFFKDSPVWTNKRYLNDIYNEKKRRYLMETQRHSHVLVYDWTNKGDVSQKSIISVSNPMVSLLFNCLTFNNKG